jgi:2-iminobutanoate/2-iminopropanoate deaminase
VIVSKDLPPVPRPYSYAVKAGGWVFTAGLIGFDASGAIVGSTPGRPDVAAQSRRALENLALAMAPLGVSFAQVAKVKGYLTDLRFRDAYNAVYREFLKPPYPPRAMVGAGLVRDHVIVEVEAIARVAGPPEEIRTPGLIPPTGPLSHGMRVGDVVFVSGFTARDARGELTGRGDMRAQAEQALDNVGAALAASGMGFADVIKINGTVPDWYGFGRYNEIFAKYFTEPFPARATIQGALGTEGALIEIEAVAARGPRRTVESEAAGASHFTLKRRDDTVYVPGLPGALAPHSHAVQVGDLVYLCGEVGYDASGRLVGPSDVRAQTRKTLDNLKSCMEALGGTMDDIVKTNVTLTDYRLVEGFNAEYATFFTAPYPARTTVVAGLAQERMVIEIEAIAVLGASQTAVAVTGPSA